MAGADLVPRIIERDLPDGVRYDLTSSEQVTITLPPTSTWSSGLHWHETHTEFLKVVKGSIKVRIGEAERVVSAGQPEVRIDKYVWHEWQRAELGGEEVVVVERTDPADGEKALFFWNLNGAITTIPKFVDGESSFFPRCPRVVVQMLLTFFMQVNIMMIFSHLDNIPAYLDLPSSRLGRTNVIPTWLLARLEWALSHVLLSMASLLGRMLGVQPVMRSYTPEREFNEWIVTRGYKDKRQ